MYFWLVGLLLVHIQCRSVVAVKQVRGSSSSEQKSHSIGNGKGPSRPLLHTMSDYETMRKTLAWLITCPKTAISGPRQNQLQPLTGDCHIEPRARFLFCLNQHNDAVTDVRTILLLLISRSESCYCSTYGLRSRQPENTSVG